MVIGPYDLSASMNKPGLITEPEVANAISQVKQYSEKTKIPLGILGSTADAVKPYIKDGYTLIAVGTDTLILGNAAKNITTLLK